MNLQHAARQATVSRERHNEADTRLHGRWLVIARVVWVALSVFTLSIFITSLPAYFAQLQTVCVRGVCVYTYGQLTSGTAQALQDLGLSVGGYAASILALAITSALVSFGVGGVLFWRRSDDWMAMLVSLFLVTFAANFITQGLENLQTAWYLPRTILTLLAWLSFDLLFYLFPDGQFVPRWTRAVAVFLVGINIFWNYSPGAFFSLPQWVIIAIFLGLGGSGVVAQIYRYVRVSGPVQRQQTKWVVFGLAATMLVIVGSYLPKLVFPSLSTSSSPYLLVFTYVYPFGFLLIPLTLGIAILRYRLWDIDVIINRTLVYGALTVSLALVYVGLVVALQFLLRGIINQNNDVAIVTSTLAIAALFQPLRQGIQRIVDRRFYRRKYDAAKIVAAFSSTLRQEVDLDTLSEQLLAVVQETMQPTFVSLWLCPPQQSEKRTTHPWGANPPPS